MLTSLRLEDLAIIERLELGFGPGLNVLTGETGAGKSILVQGLSLLLGGRSSTDWIRAGREEAQVEGLFQLAPNAVELLRARGFQVDGTELLVRRTLHKSGRSRVYLNGQLATVSLLSEVMRGTIDISGQHEHVSLFDEDHHLELLDAYAGAKALAADVRSLHAQREGLVRELEGRRLSASERARREDYLRFQLEELRELAPEEGELARLEAERLRLRHAHRLQAVCGASESTLYSGEGAVVDLLGRVERELADAATVDEALDALAARAQSILSEVEELARQLDRHGRGIEADPERLAQVEERLSALQKLAKKHGGSLENALAARAQFEAELALLAATEEEAAQGEARVGELQAALELAADRLSEIRRAGAERLEHALAKELGSLCLAGARVQVELEVQERLGARGRERALFRLAANAGEPARALAKTASGGELSRILLALKVVLAESDGVSTYVFDEVDSGVGGSVAVVLGRKLAEVARSRQVLCITHLPQVAAHADRHFRVQKERRGGRTTSQVETLGAEESVRELARMLAGAEVTPRSLELAGELRARARGRRTPEQARAGKGRRRRAA